MAVAPDQARELLAFYQDAGVDALLSETPINRVADDRATAVSGASPATATVDSVAAAAHRVPAQSNRSMPRNTELKERLQPTPPSPEAALMAAREAAKSATSLEQLRGIIATFEGCALRMTATQ